MCRWCGGEGVEEVRGCKGMRVERMWWCGWGKVRVGRCAWVWSGVYGNKRLAYLLDS